MIMCQLKAVEGNHNQKLISIVIDIKTPKQDPRQSIVYNY